MPSLSTLVDNFNDGVIGPVWGNSYGGVTETGGQARVPCTTGFAGYQTAYSWTMAGASFFVKIPTVPTAGAATECYCGVLVNSPTAGTRIGFTINAVAGLLRCKNDVGYFDAGVVEIAYDPVAMAFLRLREDAGTVYWDTSPDGTTWTNRRSLATPAWVAAEIDTCALDMSAHRNAGTADVAAYDLFNTLANGAVHTGSAALAADSALTSAALVAAHASSDLSVDSELTAAPILSAHEAVALSAQSTLTADAASSEIPEVAGLAAGVFDLRIEQGATYVQSFRVADVPGFAWTGWTARAQIRSAAASDNGELLLDLTDYLTVIGDTVRLALPAAVTETLTRNGLWDLEMVSGSTVVRLLQGRVVMSLEVTR
ncbi:hypothetical protein [Streptomyces coeruleorubidus]|uniref:Uncharacterized protein n=1 Tax=Streptomyces coeruleorubidus TaxID=116188 RepID=A0A5J6HZY4_STRC4|nr:hypothetical protein [Streptomyces coeruleorubidus]QEV23963.1 hypothetical protein CP976_07265 [Streptomyces coeruleorubidus]GGT85777.1 hypothetical protein GCM10010256_52380 [Streptomyces coeruleorubidus]